MPIFLIPIAIEADSVADAVQIMDPVNGVGIADWENAEEISQDAFDQLAHFDAQQWDTTGDSSGNQERLEE